MQIVCDNNSQAVCTMRKLFFWIHLAAGLVAGVVIFIMSLTGVLLTYEKQMVQWAETRAARIDPAGERLAPSALAAGANPGLQSMVIRRDPAAPVELSFGPEKTLFINPYTGKAAGAGAPGLRLFVRKVTLWHRWLGSQEGARGWQKQVTGASNALFVFLALSGVYLWWPRKWSPAARRTALIPQTGLSGKARDYNWHNALGFWAAVPLVVVAGSALVMSYPWANGMVYRLAGEAAPAARGGGGPRGEGRGGRPGGGLNLAAADAAFAQASSARPDWKSATIRAAGPRIGVQMDGGWGGQPQLRETFTFGPDGQLLEREGFSSQTAGRRARTWLRFLHTGEALGLTGQTVAGLASLVGLVLVWTGFSLALRRLWAWRRRRSPVAKSVEWEVASQRS
jgi:uncharacterized iron-regulated membrane protein